MQFTSWLLLFCGYAVALSKRTDTPDNIDTNFRHQLKKFVKSAERIKSQGYPVETHEVETSDGYQLTIFRIPYSHKLGNQNAYRPAVLLQHGLLSNSDCWLSNGPDHALAYLLADAGYDVWLGNARGNIYSRKNSRLSLSSSNFWHFGWHEIGTIDLAAMIDYIIGKTCQSAIHYAGHSQGTTAYFVLLSEQPQYNKKIKSGHMLAPCAFFKYGRSPVFRLLGALVGKPGGIWNKLFEDSELTPRNSLLNRLVDNACGGNGVSDEMCKNLFLAFANGGYQNTNMTALQVLLETHPGGGSANQGIHYLQLWDSEKFRQYDWGTKRNKKIYNQNTPPDYDLSKITAPTHLYSSENDALCGPKDVNTLVANFPHLTEDHRLSERSFNHLDYIVAFNVKQHVNDPVLKRMNSYEGRT